MKKSVISAAVIAAVMSGTVASAQDSSMTITRESSTSQETINVNITAAKKIMDIQDPQELLKVFGEMDSEAQSGVLAYMGSLSESEESELNALLTDIARAREFATRNSNLDEVDVAVSNVFFYGGSAVGGYGAIRSVLLGVRTNSFTVGLKSFRNAGLLAVTGYLVAGNVSRIIQTVKVPVKDLATLEASAQGAKQNLKQRKAILAMLKMSQDM